MNSKKGSVGGLAPRAWERGHEAEVSIETPAWSTWEGFAAKGEGTFEMRGGGVVTKVHSEFIQKATRELTKNSK